MVQAPVKKARPKAAPLRVQLTQFTWVKSQQMLVGEASDLFPSEEGMPRFVSQCSSLLARCMTKRVMWLPGGIPLSQQIVLSARWLFKTTNVASTVLYSGIRPRRYYDNDAKC